MHAGDSGGAWLHKRALNGTHTAVNASLSASANATVAPVGAEASAFEWVLSGIIHGGEGSGTHKKVRPVTAGDGR
jgi:hypothetical protein